MLNKNHLIVVNESEKTKDSVKIIIQSSKVLLLYDILFQ